MINAKQARLLFKSNIEKELEPLSDLITEIATEADHISLPLEYPSHPILRCSIWEYQTEKWFIYARYLTSLGFEIKYSRADGKTIISWDDSDTDGIPF